MHQAKVGIACDILIVGSNFDGPVRGMRNTMLGRLFHMLLVACALLATPLAASMAQTAQPPADTVPLEKIQALIKQLDDPEIRAWLAAKPSTPADRASASTGAQITVWEKAIRDHIAAMRNAFPHIPGEAANAVRTTKSEINDHGFTTILVLFTALLALGFGAEWLFKRAIGGEKQPPFRADGTSAASESSRSVKFLSELASLAVFSLVSAGFFLAFEWPGLLRLVILTYLVAFIVARAVVAIGRISLAPEDGAIPAGQEKPLRLIPASDAEARFWYRRLAVFTGYLMAGWATHQSSPGVGLFAGRNAPGLLPARNRTSGARRRNHLASSGPAGDGGNQDEGSSPLT